MSLQGQVKGLMRPIGETREQTVVWQLANLSSSGKVHKKPLADAVKYVKSIGEESLSFSSDQLRDIVIGIYVAKDTLSEQGSKMRGKKRERLRELSDQLKSCLIKTIREMEAAVGEGELLTRHKQAYRSLPA